MSAICSKRIWMPFRPGSPRGGKLTNLVLFHNPFLCFSFFLVGAPLFFPSRLSHDFIPLIKLICELRRSRLLVFNLIFSLFLPQMKIPYQRGPFNIFPWEIHNRRTKQFSRLCLCQVPPRQKHPNMHSAAFFVFLWKRKIPRVAVCLSLLFGKALSL